MPTIRIWALESDNDAKAVRCLANKLVEHLQLGGVSIQTVDGQRFLRRSTSSSSSGNRLRSAVQNFIAQGEYIIFVIDNDSPMSLHQRRQEPNSLINQVQRILQDRRFSDKVFFTPAIQELEVWLLIDCLGIFCYFATRRAQYRNNCRDIALATQSVVRLLGVIRGVIRNTLSKHKLEAMVPRSTWRIFLNMSCVLSIRTYRQEILIVNGIMKTWHQL